MYFPTASGNLTNSSAGILNTIRANCTTAYQVGVPYATDTLESINKVGQAILGFQAHQNEFINSLVNICALMVITSKAYKNPLAKYKKGILEFGDRIEEIFVNVCEGEKFDFNDTDEVSKMFKTRYPDVKNAFHCVNFSAQYIETVSYEMLKKAFSSINGVYDLVNKIVEAMYNGLEYDEFLCLKYMLAQLIVNGDIAIVSINTSDETNLKQAVIKMREISADFDFYSSNHNIAGVTTKTDDGEKDIIVTNKFNASNDVLVLASAFNMDKADYLGNLTHIDNFTFSPAEIKRLEKLGIEETNVFNAVNEHPEIMRGIDALLIDRDFIMLYDVLLVMDVLGIPTRLKSNHALTSQKIFSVSPFKNVCAFAENVANINGFVSVNTGVDFDDTITTVSLSDINSKGAVIDVQAKAVNTTGISAGLTWGKCSYSVVNPFNNGEVTVNNLGIVCISNVKDEITDNVTIPVTITAMQENSNNTYFTKTYNITVTA